jgi:hypothetical protein
MMNAVFAAKQMFLDNGLNFEEQVGWYLCNGFLINRPDCFMMAKPINSARGDDEWNVKDADCWYVHCLVGKLNLEQLVDAVGYSLPKVAWRRMKDGNNTLRVYNWHNFKRLVK